MSQTLLLNNMLPKPPCVSFYDMRSCTYDDNLYLLCIEHALQILFIDT